MGSRKRQAIAREVAEFKASLGGMDDIFAKEDARTRQSEIEHDEALRRKACESKNRYAHLSEAQDAIDACAEHGTSGLHAYRCPYCNGWHLTSKPQRLES
jgi:hypothetical protein